MAAGLKDGSLTTQTLRSEHPRVETTSRYSWGPGERTAAGEAGQGAGGGSTYCLVVVKGCGLRAPGRSLPAELILLKVSSKLAGGHAQPGLDPCGGPQPSGQSSGGPFLPTAVLSPCVPYGTLPPPSWNPAPNPTYIGTPARPGLPAAWPSSLLSCFAVLRHSQKPCPPLTPQGLHGVQHPAHG